MPIDPAFAPLLRNFDLEELDAADATIFGVWSDLRLGYTNRAWAQFAEANGGRDILDRWPIGASIAQAISGPLAAWFREIVTGARALQPAGFVYPCSSPFMEREFRLTAYPLDGAGLLLVHSLIHASPLDPGLGSASADPDDAAYRNAHGLLVQCSHCKRFRAAEADNRWDWIPAWIERAPVLISHGLCPVCVGFYYP